MKFFFDTFRVRRKLGLFGDVGLKWKVSRDESSSSGDIIRDDVGVYAQSNS